MTSSVVVVGGGYGGHAVAKALDADATSHIKGKDLFVGRYREIFGLED